MSQNALFLFAWLAGLIVAVLAFVGAPDLLVAVAGFAAPVALALYARNQRNRREQVANGPPRK
jgi:Flp pilus assembly protein TadB